MVTARLARPWTWCDPSAAPLYATGAETTHYHDVAWAQGEARGCRVGGGADMLWPVPLEAPSGTASLLAMISKLQATAGAATAAIRGSEGAPAPPAPPASPAPSAPPAAAQQPSRLRRALGINGTRWNGTRRVPMAGDVVAFITRVHAIWNSHAFVDSPDEAQRASLFGMRQMCGTADSPSLHAGRQCSLNLHRLSSLGTLEFRGFHATLDSRAVVDWCAFCVSFVDVFRHVDSCAAYLDVGLAAGLAELRLAQERASLEELHDLMDGGTSAGCRASFRRLWDGCA